LVNHAYRNSICIRPLSVEVNVVRHLASSFGEILTANGAKRANHVTECSRSWVFILGSPRIRNNGRVIG
jgi:hypothetical protein